MPENQDHPRARLHGWKDIAAHFDKGVRTVQRWEKDVGLPVRRLGPGPSESVYAFTDELEAWSRRAATSGQPAGEEASPRPRTTPDRPGAVHATSGVPARRWGSVPALIIGAVALVIAGVWVLLAARGGAPNTVRADLDLLSVVDANDHVL